MEQNTTNTVPGTEKPRDRTILAGLSSPRLSPADLSLIHI